MSAAIATYPAPAESWADRARRVAAEFGRNAARHDADDSFVADNYARLKAEGFFKAHVPAELGGGGASYRDMCDAIRCIAASCGATGLAFAMHTHLVAAAVWRRQHQNAPTEGLLKRVAAEDLVLVSSGGSDWLKSAGTAVKTDDGFLITARKAFSSGCRAGDLLMTSAVYDDPWVGPTVLHFGVPLKAKGVTINETWKVMGMRETGSDDVVMEDVFVAEAAISGRRPQAKWHMLFHVISMIAFPLIYAAYAGVAEGARAEALKLVKGRADDGDLPILAGELENAFAQTEMALERMIDTAETQMPGAETTSRTMVARTLAGEAAIRTVTQALELAGGGAFYRKHGLERAFRDVQGARFHPLQGKAQLRYSGRVALGLDIDG
ncbi:MAG: acyl-CoA dehydrogenase family protein [Micropepsaceae bacterium]